MPISCASLDVQAQLWCFLTGAGYSGASSLPGFTTGWAIALIASIASCALCAVGGNLCCHVGCCERAITEGDVQELGELADNLLPENEDESGAPAKTDATSSGCAAKIKAMAAAKLSNFLHGSLPPVTGSYRRVYVSIDMCFTYVALAISAVLNFYTIFSLWKLPWSSNDTLFGVIPEVPLFAFYLFVIELVRLLAAFCTIPFQLLMRPSLLLGASKVLQIALVANQPCYFCSSFFLSVLVGDYAAHDAAQYHRERYDFDGAGCALASVDGRHLFRRSQGEQCGVHRTVSALCAVRHHRHCLDLAKHRRFESRVRVQGDPRSRLSVRALCRLRLCCVWLAALGVDCVCNCARHASHLGNAG